MYAVKQFRHYLLGSHFTVLTDHNPLVWLSSQKMQGRLSRWALALQEHDYTIKYRKGSQNDNADALSRLPNVESAAIRVSGYYSQERIQELQQEDPMIKIVMSYLAKGHKPDQQDQQTLPCQIKWWLQIWSQLVVKEGILFRRIRALGCNQDKEVLVAPASMKSFFLQQCHDIPSAGHQGLKNHWTV